VNRFPDELDELIARTKLETLGIELGSSTEAQERFRRAWAASA
jgi:S-adenosylhomocysteine hydrolase